MSYLSVNNPPSVNLGNRQVDLPAPMPTPLGGSDASKLLGHNPKVFPEQIRNVEVGRDSATVGTDALSKLLDMFELLFKAMRDVLSGKTKSPDAQPAADKPSETRPLPGSNPVIGGKDAKVQVEADKQPEKKPDAESKPAIPGKDAKVQVEADKQPEKKPDAESKPALPGKDAKVQVEADKQPEKKPDAEGKPVVPGQDAKVQIEPGKQPVVIPEIRILPRVPGKDLNVLSDTAVRVNVDVHVNNCHCPAPLRPAVPGGDVSVMSDTQPKPAVVPGTEGRVRPSLESKPAVVPGTDAQVKPDVVPPLVPGVVPDKPVPDTDLTSPGPECGPGEMSWTRNFYRRR